ncbi:MAG: primosomal protein N' [Candidatus Woesebacteria bacterium]|jgi:primosomal protein N' (replication factor Y)
MYYYLIAPTVIIRKDEHAFTYHSQGKLAVGTIVKVSIGKKESNGIILKAVDKPAFKTKPIISTLSSKPIPKQLINLAHWISEYYSTPLPHVLQTILPTGLHKKRRSTNSTALHVTRERTNIVLNSEQAVALKAITNKKTGTLLLHGVTGGGKTQVYIEAAKNAQDSGRSSIILVPEISLTPQLVAEFSKHFNNIILTHSRMTEAERHMAWMEVLNNPLPVIIIGPRSALFMPVIDLGLIVIDECHEASFKQDQSPKYSALRAASVLAKLHKATAVFGSATPQIADYYLAQKTSNSILKIQHTAKKAEPPVVSIIDSKKRDNHKEHHIFSDVLLASIRNSLADNQQIILFHNRRGTAPMSLCTKCGWTSLCAKCLTPNTLHADKHKLLCHLCGDQQNVPPCCPDCGFPDIAFKGVGTKMLESEIKKIFPKAIVSRFDADNNQDETLSAKYQDLYDGKINIAIGTQILAKGLDLPHLGVVGIIQADCGLNLPDYMSEERTFQLIHQISGRVGRNKNKSHVVIQTFQPSHPTIQLASRRNYDDFFATHIKQRQQQFLPPFAHILKLVCVYKTEANAIKAAQIMSTTIRKTWANVEVSNPVPAFYERLGGNYRWQILVKSNNRKTLVDITSDMPANWQVDLDPSSLL